MTSTRSSKKRRASALDHKVEAEEAPPDPLGRVTQRPGPKRVLRWALILALLYLFLLGVNGLGEGFKLLGRTALDSFFAATENPFVGLVVGILSTSLVQSSSVTTSLIVGLVAAPENPLPLENAVPMVMGANFGTTVTNTVVALAHMRNKTEFRRAFGVSVCDDFFNLYAVAIILPLELITGFLRHSATALSGMLTGFRGVEYESPLKGALEAGLSPLVGGLEAIFTSQQLTGAVLAVLSFGLIFGALVMLIRTLRASLQSRARQIVSNALDKNPLISMLGGLLVTAMIQSSSITTSLLVPLAGAGLLTLKRAFPIVLGANLGTTLTALMASLAATGPNARAGISIAVVHLLFNLFGILLFYPVAWMRRLPLGSSRWLADVAFRSAPWAIAYVILLFYGIPVALAGVTGALR